MLGLCLVQQQCIQEPLWLLIYVKEKTDLRFIIYLISSRTDILKTDTERMLLLLHMLLNNINVINGDILRDE